MKLRGQSAMEFLMTYGWAILVMVIVIGVLFYVGVFNPGTAAPSACTLGAGFSCYSYIVYPGNGTLTLEVGQATGNAVTITGVACDARTTAGNWTSMSRTVQTGKHYVIGGIPCYKSTGIRPGAGEFYSGTIFLNYTDAETQITHTIKGDLSYRLGNA